MECRICFGDDRPETMRIPCRCRGTSAYVHEDCLRTYFSYYPDRICRVCQYSMGYPTVDTERNFVCATLLLVWAATLLALSTVPIVCKVLAYVTLTLLLIFHVRRNQLTYEATFACLSVTGLLFMTEPQHLPQTVFLSMGLWMILTLCLFMPPDALVLIFLLILGFAYSVLLTLAIAVRTDPAFTALFLLSICSGWIVFLRPTRVR
jgi:hypothetical protein